jgi:hypothetical protein
VIARPGVGGSVLVIDQDAEALGDRRLVAHLTTDEPAANARVVAELYLADPQGRFARALEDRDWVTLADGREPPDGPEPPAPGELRDAHGRRYRLAAVDDYRYGRQTRWLRRGARGRSEPVSVRTVIGALEAYEPARALTRTAVARSHRDTGIDVLMGALRARQTPGHRIGRGRHHLASAPAGLALVGRHGTRGGQRRPRGAAGWRPGGRPRTPDAPAGYPQSEERSTWALVSRRCL